VLLDLASLILEEQQSLEVLLRKIAGTILSFMQAQGCTVFIADGDVMVSSRTHARMHTQSNLTVSWGEDKGKSGKMTGIEKRKGNMTGIGWTVRHIVNRIPQ
jgi:hypothetical protein